MRKICVLLLFVSFFLLSCNHSKRNIVLDEKLSKWDIERLEEKTEIFIDADSSRNGMLLIFTLDYPSKSKLDSLLLAKIQSAFVLAFTGNNYNGQSPKDAFQSFLNKNVKDGVEMGELAKDDGEDFTSYFRYVTTLVFDTTNIYITAKTVSEDYTGGAHGAHHAAFYNIDLSNGEILTEKDLFKTKKDEMLIELLQKELNDTLSKGRSITILDMGDVKPNNNFYFDEKGLVYVFNEYEIAPYSDGLIEIRLPYSELSGLASPILEDIISAKAR